MALKPGGPPLPGDGSGDRHMPGGQRPLDPANGGVTGDWGKVILMIKEDLTFGEMNYPILLRWCHRSALVGLLDLNSNYSIRTTRLELLDL